MENKNEIFNLPLASFTFGKDDQKLENHINNIKFSNSKQIYMNNNNLQNSEINKNVMHPSLSQDYFQQYKNNNYNTSMSNNFSNNLKKIIDLNNNNNLNEKYYNSNFFNTNQSAKIISSNYGGEFTFGQSNEFIQNIKEINNFNEEKNHFNNTLNNNYYNNNSLHFNNINNNNYLKNNDNIIPPFFLDENNNDTNSYIIVILYTIYHIKSLKNYINNLNISKNENNNILYSLKEICNKIENNINVKIDIKELKESLSYSFKNRRKFILNQPDDPIDLFFVLLNSLHSFCIKSPINEISEELCNGKCFSHKYIWMDLTRIDSCECNGTTRRLFSNHNYITDIPVYKILNIISNNLNYSLDDNYEKIFVYYKDILNNINMNCPLNGNRCNINKTHHRLFLANSPSYFIFNLDYNQNNNINNIFNNYTLLNILKCYIIITKTLDIYNLFEENIMNKNNYNFNKKYNLIGIIFLSLTKIYSCAFKIYNNKNIVYNYYMCNKNINNKNNDNYYICFNSFYNLIFYALKNGLIPIMLIYQEKSIDNNINCNNDILSKEQILFLEKYCINNDNLFKTIFFNKIRNDENILATFTNSPNNNMINIQNSLNNNNLKKSDKIMINSNTNPNLIEKNNNINYNTENNYYSKNKIQKSQYNTNTYKNKSEQKSNQIYKNNINNINSDEKRVRLSLQNKKMYINNNLINEFNENNLYIINKRKNFNTNENNPANNDNKMNIKRYKKIKNEYDPKIKNKIHKNNNEEITTNLWDMPTPYLQYKKEEPIALIPIQNQNSLEVNKKTSSNNYFYKNKNINSANNIKNTPLNNINNNSSLNNLIDNNNNKKEEMNSYNKKNIVNNNNIKIDNINSEYNIKNNMPINNNNINSIYYNYNNNPNSFNRNHNLRNMIKDNNKKYGFNKINKSNFDLSSNRPSNYRYENNISNISYNNQNIKHISDEIISSDEIKKKFKSKKMINQVINYSNNSNKLRSNNLNIDNNGNISNKNRNISKSEDNTNNNIYNFNYIYNNNNFDMNILGNNVDKNNNFNIINKSYEKQKINLKKNNNIININNISNINTNTNNKGNNNIKSQLKHNDIGHWTCDYCSNINRDDLIYCKICRRNKKGKILRINTQLLISNNKKNGNLGNRPGTSTNSNKKMDIPKKNLQNSNSTNNRMNKINKNIQYPPTSKRNMKKLKRNTVVSFSSSKNFKNNENYMNYINNQNQKNINMGNDVKAEGMKKEYSFTKGDFGDRKYNL